MADKLAVIQSEQTVKELGLIEEATKNLIVQFDDLVAKTNAVSSSFNKGVLKDYAAAQKSLVAIEKQRESVAKQLAAAQLQLERLATQSTKTTNELSKSRVSLANAERAEANAAKAKLLLQQQEIRAAAAQTKAQGALANAYDQINAKHKEAFKAAQALGAQFGVLSQEFLEAAKVANQYDLQLKKIDSALGKFNRNVGNYHGDMFGLNAQMGQVLREMPNFAISAQTGIMSLSNNLPYFADAIGNVKAEAKAMKLEFEGVAASSKAMAIENALLEGSTREVAEALGAQAEAQVMASYQASKAPGVMAQLGKALVSWQTIMIVGVTLLTLYGKEIIEWTKNMFNASRATDTLRISTEALNKTLESTEAKKAALDIFEMKNVIEQARKGMITAEKATSFWNEGLGKVAGSANNLNEAETKLNNMAPKYLKAVALKAAANLVLAQSAEAALRATQAALDPESNLNWLDKTAAFFMGSKESEDYLKRAAERRTKRIQDAADKEIEANNKVINTLMTRFNTMSKGFDLDFIDFGSNSRKERVAKGLKDQKDSLREEYEIAKDHIDHMFQVQQESVKNLAKLAKDDPFLAETEKLNEQEKHYANLAKLNQDYYNALIENAKKFGMDRFIIDFERTRDTKAIEIDSERVALANKRAEAVRKDLLYIQGIEDSTRELSEAEAERLIVADKTLTTKQREYLLNQLALKHERDALDIERTRLQARGEYLGSLERLTRDEQAELAGINAQLAVLNNEITEADKNLRNLELAEIFEGLTPIANFLTQGLNDLGLDRVADQFSSMFAKIQKDGVDFKLSTEDIMNASAALIADFGDQLVTRSKERRVAELNEQLKASQSMTEQELGFIESRLAMLNSIQDATVEQIAERNALEDEARTFREQQMQREKMIATQKARAEQKAQAQSALISAGVAAVNSYASLAAIPVVGPALGAKAAGVALAFGVIQSALIMSRDPVPKYFVGRNNGGAEWAWTQERGRELITDKKGRVKSLGHDKGASMTWLDEGDKVFTSSQTRNIIDELGSLPKVGDDVYQKMVVQKLSPIILDRGNSSGLSASDVGAEFDRVMRRYDKPTVWTDANGDMFKQEGSKIPQYIGRQRPRPINVKMPRNERN